MRGSLSFLPWKQGSACCWAAPVLLRNTDLSSSSSVTPQIGKDLVNQAECSKSKSTERHEPENCPIQRSPGCPDGWGYLGTSWGQEPCLDTSVAFLLYSTPGAVHTVDSVVSSWVNWEHLAACWAYQTPVLGSFSVPLAEAANSRDLRYSWLEGAGMQLKAHSMHDVRG